MKELNLLDQTSLNAESVKQESDKLQHIETITDVDRQAFLTWYEDKNHKQRLKMPANVARYLALPKEVLSAAPNPSCVTLNLEFQANSWIDCIVFAKQDKPISSQVVLDAYLRTVAEQTSHDSSTDVPITEYATALEGLDYQHTRLAERIKDGRLALEDYVYLDFGLHIQESNNQNLYVYKYEDRPELRGKNIGLGFYTRLRECAKYMGFRFITGSNNFRNISFFTSSPGHRSLGRSTIAEIRPEYRNEFFTLNHDDHLDLLTVDFLHPADKQKYLINPQTNYSPIAPQT